MKHLCLLFLILASTTALGSDSKPNYHLVGWLNTFVPGGGQLLLGNYGLAALQASLEVSTIYYGHHFSNQSGFSIDGARAQLPEFNRRSPRNQADLTTPIYGDMLQEFGIKFHMVNVFNAYREAAPDDAQVDRSSTLDLFTAPFKTEHLTNPWVYVPMALVGAATVVDYYISRAGQDRLQPIQPYSNFLYFMDYAVVEPIGSGAPEEMFYRGFLQKELYDAVPSPFFSVLGSAAIFAFSHEAGAGRIGAGVAGTYLGFLAYKYHGNLAPGITLHYWSGIFLGIETILLSHFAQHTTPPAGFSMQINY